jgi:hypothetical protein
VKLPAGWKAATSLEVAAQEGSTVRCQPVTKAAHAAHPGPYVDDLSELQAHIEKEVEQLKHQPNGSANDPAKAKD